MTTDQRVKRYEQLLLLALDQVEAEGAEISQIAFWQNKAANLASILTALKGMNS